MGIFDFFKRKREQPDLMVSGSCEVFIPEERFVCGDVQPDPDWEEAHFWLDPLKQ